MIKKDELRFIFFVIKKNYLLFCKNIYNIYACVCYIGTKLNKMDKIQITFEGVEFKPSQLKFSKYALVGTYGKAEAEEAMARLIEFSQKEGKWVAVSLEDFAQSVEASLKEMRRADEIRVRNNQKRDRYEEKCRHSKNGRAEIPEPTYETEIEVPFSTLTLNPDAMIVGLKYLVANNYLEKMDVGETIYIKPTLEGINRLKKFVQ